MKRALFVAISFLAACSTSPSPAGTAAQALNVCSMLPLAAPPQGRIVFQQCRDPGTPTEHLFVLGCIDCDGAVYSEATLLLTNGASLGAIPTTYALRVSNRWNGRVVAYVPGGTLTHVPYAPWQAMLGAAGFATVNLNHPLPGHPEIPRAFPGYDPRAIAPAYMRAGAVVRAVLGRLAPVQRLLAFGFSRGMLAGLGLLLARADSPFDGYVVGGGGDGFLPRLRMSQQILATPAQRQVCTGGVTDVTGVSYEVANERLLGDVRIVEPGYTGTGFDYRVEDRPKAVAELWEEMQFGADLARPTVIVQGLQDGVVPSLLTLKHAVRVVTAGKGDLLRLYFFKTRGHGASAVPAALPNFPQSLYYDAILNLDAWVHGGEWPQHDAVTERLASETPALSARSQVSCHALLGGASWKSAKCQDDPYKWEKDDLQECPDPDHPKVTSCAPWDCYLRVLSGP